MSIAVLVPTRGRPDNIRRLIEAFTRTAAMESTHLWVCVDRDDLRCDEYKDVQAQEWGSPVLWTYGEPARLAAWHNRMAPQLWQKHTILGSWGDDHYPHTQGWDVLVDQAFASQPQPALVYGDDGFQGATLPTASFLHSNIVKAFGYWCPPRLEHLYIDNWWDEVGKAFGRRYLPEMKIEHLHWQTGQADNDETYQRGTAQAIWEHDQAEFELYMAHRWEAEVQRAQQMLARQQTSVIS